MRRASFALPLMLVCACSSGNSSDAPADDSSVTTDAGDVDGRADSSTEAETNGDTPTPPGTITVHPTEIDDVLTNPGMGFADFEFAWGSEPPLTEYPASSVAYFRWTWTDLEPTEGAYNFAVVDDTVAKAKAKNETLAFRIMPSYDTSTPKWLLDKGVAAVTLSDGSNFPDHNDPIFLDAQAKLVHAFGARYGGTPEIDHVDVGQGCWGEWNTACCDSTTVDKCNAYFTNDANAKAITDLYAKEFAGTPLVMLVGGPVAYATSKGMGWRGDCFGDYGIFSSTWNHMVNVYTPVATDPATMNAWQKAPVQFEACDVMQTWHDKGFDIDLILQKGLDWHLSVFNGKSSPVPSDWRPKVDAWLKKIGYRLVVQSVTHDATVSAGGKVSIGSNWVNKGVAPMYHRWPLAWRMRDKSGKVITQKTSTTDLRNWLPGAQSSNDTLDIPAGTPGGEYALELAILAEDGSHALVHVAIAGAGTDLWYPVSTITVK